MLSPIDAELKLVIAGNHDLELDKGYWDSHLDKGDEAEDHFEAIEVMKGQRAINAGIRYLEEGMHRFTLSSGATFSLYTSPYTPAFCDWAFAYGPDHDRFNSSPHVAQSGVTSIMAENPIPSFPDVDIIMTHGPPQGILDECPQGNVGCSKLLQAVRRARPLMHCFGHIHEGYGAKIIDWESENTVRDQPSIINNASMEPISLPLRDGRKDGRQTLMINAAMMNARNEPTNTPWVVDLELPTTSST